MRIKRSASRDFQTLRERAKVRLLRDMSAVLEGCVSPFGLTLELQQLEMTPFFIRLEESSRKPGLKECMVACVD